MFPNLKVLVKTEHKHNIIGSYVVQPYAISSHIISYYGWSENFTSYWS